MTTTFEILNLAGDWKPVIGRSLNTIDPRTGSSVYQTHSRESAYKAYTAEYAADSLKYFQQYAGFDRVRVAQ